MSRKRFTATPQQRSQVSYLIGLGLTHEQVRALIVNPDTGKPIDQKIFKREFDAQILTGAARADSIVAGSLFKNAKSGNVAAQIFWLKARCGWREVTRHEHTGRLTDQQIDAELEALEAEAKAKGVVVDDKDED